MIISHRHRFIFQRCRKTAGSSIQIALSCHLGPLDLQLGSWSEVSCGGGRQNLRMWLELCTPRTLFRLATDALSTGKISANRALKQKYQAVLGPVPAHAEAIRVREFDPQAWDQYFKFCFVRNPYAKAVSDWKWRMEMANAELPFADWLAIQLDDADSPFRSPLPDNWPIYAIDDKIAVDFVGRQERLEADLNAVFDHIGLPFPPQLPEAKRAPPRENYRAYYTGIERKLVERLFAKEIEAFEYKF